MAILLMASMVVMLYYSRKAVKEEATQKAQQTLDCTIYTIDNILLSVEQTTGNIFWSMMTQLNNQDMMFTYARKLVETNPYVAGCAIAYNPDYTKDGKPFMAYMHRADSAGVAYAAPEIVSDDKFADSPYTEQIWYTEPMKTGKARWLNPLKGMESEEAPIITFSLPISSGTDQKPVGVIGVDVSLSLLSEIVAKSKPSKNSYCTLIDNEGTFIVHPISNKLMNKAVQMVKEESAKEAAETVMSGKTGYKSFNMDGNDFYVFYKPFKRIAVPGRTAEDLGWNASIIYPEDDIFGDYNDLSYYVLVIAIIGLLLSFVISTSVIHWQLKPLLMLTEQAQRIAKEKMDETIPDSQRIDEIGRLQDNFKQMQHSLAANICELEHLTTELKEHGKELNAAYKQAQKADRMKTAFLHNMTNQMIEPAESINKDVEVLCDFSQKRTHQDTIHLTDNIQQNGNTIAELLKNLINISDEDIRKEATDA
jgi:methyl-accepting chemotaxis protein